MRPRASRPARRFSYSSAIACSARRPLVRLRGQLAGQPVTLLFQFAALQLRRLQCIGGGGGKPRQFHLFTTYLAQCHADRVAVARQRNHHRVGVLGSLAHRSEPQMAAMPSEQPFQFRNRGNRDAYRGERRVSAARYGGQVDAQLRPRGNAHDPLAQRVQFGDHLFVVGEALLQLGPVRMHVYRRHQSVELGVAHGRRRTEEVLQHARLVRSEALKQVQDPAGGGEHAIYRRGVHRLPLLPLRQFIGQAVVHVVHVQQGGLLKRLQQTGNRIARGDQFGLVEGGDCHLESATVGLRVR